MSKKLGIPEVAMVAGYTLLYLLLPTVNSTSDALGYAALPQTGSHHLLYDKLCMLTLQICGNSAIWNLALLKVLNALFGGGILWMSVQLLRQVRPGIQILPWILLLGSCFSLMRFATENETYILPFFLSLTGTYYSVLFYTHAEKKQLITAAAFLTAAVLFHQIHIFWWLAVFTSLWLQKKLPFRLWPVPLFSVVFVLLVYIFSAWQSDTPFVTFLLGSTLSETVQLAPGIDNFKFTAINFVRSFVQIHGNIWLLFSQYTVVKILLILAILLILIATYFLLRTKPKKSEAGMQNKYMNQMLVLAFLLHLAFAWYSVGNAEFMVMLPTILFIYLAIKREFSEKVIWIFGSALIVWNLAGGIVPSHFISYENTETNVSKMRSRPGIYIAQNQTLVHNYYLYAFSDPDLRSVDDGALENYLLKSPADMDNTVQLRNTIDTALKLAIPVFTDCVNYPSPISRKSMFNGDRNARFFEQYQLVRYDSFESFYGKVLVHRVLAKSQSYASGHQGYQSVPYALLPNGK